MTYRSPVAARAATVALRPRGPRTRPSLSPGLRALIERVARTHRRRARLIVARCLDLLPNYHKLPVEMVRTVHENVRYHVALFYRLMLEGRPVTSQELEPARHVARERARQGVPLGELFTFYQVGFTMVWEQLIARGGTNPIERAELLDQMAAVVSSHTRVTTATAEAYVEERERLSRFHDEAFDDFTRLLLTRDAPPTAVQAHARSLGVDLDLPWSVALFCPPPSTVSQEAGAKLESTRRLISTCLKPLGGIVGRTQEGFVTLLPDGGIVAEDLAEMAKRVLGPAGCIGLGGRAEDIAGICRSAREALRAVRIGALVHPHQTLYRYTDVAIFDLVRVGSDEAEEFSRRVLGALADQEANAIYLRTLRELCAHGFCVKLAAASLAIHPNTLTYRMRQIRDRCGIDLQGANARLHVQLALLVRDGVSSLRSPAHDASA